LAPVPRSRRGRSRDIIIIIEGVHHLLLDLRQARAEPLVGE